jgi:hypothetical protein
MDRRRPELVEEKLYQIRMIYEIFRVLVICGGVGRIIMERYIGTIGPKAVLSVVEGFVWGIFSFFLF